MRKLLSVPLLLCVFVFLTGCAAANVQSTVASTETLTEVDSDWIARETAYADAIVALNKVADLSAVSEAIAVKEFLNQKATLGRPLQADMQVFDPGVMKTGDRIVIVPVLEVDIPNLNEVFDFGTKRASYLPEVPSIWFRTWGQDSFLDGLVLIHEGKHAMQFVGWDPNRPIDIEERVVFETETYGLQCKILRAIGGPEYMDILESIIKEINSNPGKSISLEWETLGMNAGEIIKASGDFEDEVTIPGLYLWIDANFLKIERESHDEKSALIEKLNFMEFEFTKGELRY